MTYQSEKLIQQGGVKIIHTKQRSYNVKTGLFSMQLITNGMQIEATIKSCLRN